MMVSNIKAKVNNQAIGLTVSIGLVMFCADDKSVDEVLRCADIAITKPKQGGAIKLLHQHNTATC